jgi:hypothetical protein
MVYGNLLWLKRALYETEDVARAWDQALAFELRVAAGRILMERKQKAEAEKEKTGAGDQKKESALDSSGKES